ncbi:MAG: 50S ribosomal protein L22, partial [Desulfobacterales bacterium]
MEARATGKYMRISPQKVRSIVGAVKGQPVEAGLNQLKFMPQKASGVVEKVLRSAVANADQQGEMDIDSLMIKNIIVNEG